MFPGMGGGQPPPRPYHGKLAFIVNAYNDPFQWSLVKSFLGFTFGVIAVRTWASEFAADQLPVS